MITEAVQISLSVCCRAKCQGRRGGKGTRLALCNILRSCILTLNGVHVWEINLVNMERSKRDHIQKILMKILWRENSIPIPRPIKLEMNSENIVVRHRGIGRIRLLWRRHNLSSPALLNVEGKPVITWNLFFLHRQHRGYWNNRCCSLWGAVVYHKQRLTVPDVSHF